MTRFVGWPRKRQTMAEIACSGHRVSGHPGLIPSVIIVKTTRRSQRAMFCGEGRAVRRCRMTLKALEEPLGPWAGCPDWLGVHVVAEKLLPPWPSRSRRLLHCWLAIKSVSRPMFACADVFCRVVLVQIDQPSWW